MKVLSKHEFDDASFEASANDAGKRLDAFLAERVESLPRTACRDAIAEGRVSVEGIKPNKVKPSLKLSAGMQVHASLPRFEERMLGPSEIDVDVLFEDDDIMVFNKPAGMATHPQQVDDRQSLASVVLRHCPDAPCPDGEELRPGIVHRLDADTSGAIIVAKTATAMEKLKEQFREHQVEKRYLAVVHGTPDKMEFEINTPIGRDPNRPPAMRLDKEGGKSASTVFRGVERFRGFALEEAIPLTGRTHQIRVHLQARGYPIVADRLYSTQGLLRFSDLNEEVVSQRELMGRQALHAAYLAFNHPTSGERMSIQAPLADDFAALLEALREFAPWKASQ